MTWSNNRLEDFLVDVTPAWSCLVLLHADSNTYGYGHHRRHFWPISTPVLVKLHEVGANEVYCVFAAKDVYRFTAVLRSIHKFPSSRMRMGHLHAMALKQSGGHVSCPHQPDNNVSRPHGLSCHMSKDSYS